MSGIDEKKPICPFCDTRDEKEDSRKNEHHLLFSAGGMKWLARTTSKIEDEKFGARIIIENFDLDKTVLTTVRCSYCHVILDPYLTLKAKKYFWRLKERKEILTSEEWMFHVRKFLPVCDICKEGAVGYCRCTTICGGCGEYQIRCDCRENNEDYYDENGNSNYDENGIWIGAD
jgi:hypothetical protein